MVGSPSMRRNRRPFSRMLDWLTHILFSTSCMPIASNMCWAWLLVLGDEGMLLILSAPRVEKSLHLWVHFLTPPLHVQPSQERAYIPGMVGMALKLSSLLPLSWTSVIPSIQVWQRKAVPTPHDGMGGCQVTTGAAHRHCCCAVEEGGRPRLETQHRETREVPSGALVLGLLPSTPPFLGLGYSIPPAMTQTLLLLLTQAGSS